jgi:hypothetical protein
MILLGGCGWLLKEPFFGVELQDYLLALLAFLGQQDGLDVGQNTTLGDGHTRQKFVQFLVITDGQLQVTGDDPALLVISGSIACQFKNLSCQVFHDCSQVHWGTSTYSLGIVSFPQMPVDPTHWELQASTA